MLRYMVRVIQGIASLPATLTFINVARRLSTSGMSHAYHYSQPQSVATLACLVLIYHAAEVRRLSWPACFGLRYRGGTGMIAD